ncbi:MAG: hypothetical protein U1F58_11445 [Burkholderiales bacterium]
MDTPKSAAPFPQPPVGKPRKTYRPPSLVAYGQVRSLTQATTSGSAEGSGGNPPFMTMSDAAAKQNALRIGTHPLGIGLYLFEYKPQFRARWGYGRQLGVMADEVEKVMPDAVRVGIDGLRVVDYARLGVARPRR